MSDLQNLLQLRAAPVAITFRPAAPAGVAHVERPEPAGCGYWRRAAAGEVFYTDADDHKKCPVGAHTHGVKLNDAEAKELQGLIGTMVSLEYLSMDEIPSIPTRKEPFGVAVYAPIDRAPLPPDVVLVRGNARQLMLLNEAAQAAGVDHSTPTMGRPTCALLPEALESRRAGASLGCIGNRVYTALDDSDAYFAIPGPSVSAIEERLRTIVHANAELEKFHRGRLQT
ncbi:MAG TPA: DUF169 domain-containing protein [Polyangia bacterium]|jgi:uncharacterized protein (DUF169 family)